MTLGYSTQMFGKPNYFIEKIYESLLYKNFGGSYIDSAVYLQYQKGYLEKFGHYWDGTGDMEHHHVNPKSHTMREDSHDRWKPGMDIHMVINNRTKNRFQFAPVVKCVSTQIVEIKDATHLTFKGSFTKISKTVTRDEWTETFTQVFYVKVDGVQLSQKMVRKLAINDGFDSVEDFFAYFSSSCTRKLIHWTDLRY